MNYKLLSLYSYQDFPVFWKTLEDGTTLISSGLFELSVNHGVNEKNISVIVNQVIVELYSDIITIH